MFNMVNPEAIGVFGLIVTVFVFGLEQIGIGVNKNSDMTKVSRSLANIALIFGGFCQLFTALSLWFFDLGIDPGTRQFLGMIFATYGAFWVVVAMHFYNPGDKKVYAHFFLAIFLLSAAYAYKAFEIGKGWPLGTVLLLINVLTILLPFAWYDKYPALTKVCGVVNILIAICSIPLLTHALGL
ncbi:hypothetical protein [Bacillus massiliigorillae]|uniref:hypothetical protein n=1 Tax=Bacillus massiliigorillae TaxID=1243664 RepID=UPI0003A0D51F|nr:hypothetical protein [Bacillus massiliigorillae]